MSGIEMGLFALCVLNFLGWAIVDYRVGKLERDKHDH